MGVWRSIWVGLARLGCVDLSTCTEYPDQVEVGKYLFLLHLIMNITRLAPVFIYHYAFHLQLELVSASKVLSNLPNSCNVSIHV